LLIKIYFRELEEFDYLHSLLYSFMQMVLPCEDNLLRNVTLDRPAHHCGRFDRLPHDIEHGMMAVFEQELALNRRQDVLRADCEHRYDYTIAAAWRSVDRHHDGRIDTFNLGAFLRSCGHYAGERELLSIIRRLDTDGDARLSFAEFSEFMRGAGPVPVVLAHPVVLSHPVPMPLPVYASPVRVYHPSPVRVYHPSPVRVYSSPVRVAPVLRASSAPRIRAGSPVRSMHSRRPLHLPEEDALVTSLKDLCSGERELEAAKTALTLKSDFNLVDAFNIFDVNRDGQIDAHELRHGLSAIGVHPTSEDIELFVTRYDKSGDRRLNRTEFAVAFLCLDAHYCSTLERRASNYRCPGYRADDCFFSDTANVHRDLWRVHFKTEHLGESVRQKMKRNPYFNDFEAFNSLDLDGSGGVSAQEIHAMLQSRGFFASHKEVHDLVDKFDKTRTGQISFGQFRDEMEPKSPVRH
jgi:Ca2+-binding EF-hand superfamily protein